MRIGRASSIAAVALTITWACSGEVRNGSSAPPDGTHDRPDGPSAGAGGSGHAGTDAGSLAGGGGLLTPAEWAAKTAPRAGPHRVVTADCAGTPIGQDYLVTPTIVCNARTGVPQTNTCDVAPLCMFDTDCTERPRGVCTGSPDAHCNYDVPAQSCRVDSDCTALPDGRCAPPSGERSCDPTGSCTLNDTPSCYYPPAPCAADRDCTAAPGGVCEKRILFPRCEYRDCNADADCGQGGRCACHTCVPSECTDGSCGPGQQCVLETGCGIPQGYHCTTPSDDCIPGDTCPWCAYESGKFTCRQCPRTP